MDPDGKGDPTNGIDGWRLDVADERPTEFWAEWNAYVRRINPQAYTTAETWKDPRPMIVDGGFSATMNYFGFAIPVKGWLADNHLTPSRFAGKLDERRNALPAADAYVMQNLIDSHDTDRLASMIVNGEKIQYQDADQVDYNAHADVHNSPNYLIGKPDDRDRAIQRLVVLMQMTYVGAPMIYYGDEAGMWGAGDPDNRQPMVWADRTYEAQAIDPRTGAQEPQAVGFDKALFAFYKSAIALRRAHPALNRGDYELLDADDSADTVVFCRKIAQESLIVAINRSDSAQKVTVAAASLAKPAILFSTTEPATATEVSAGGGTS